MTAHDCSLAEFAVVQLQGSRAFFLKLIETLDDSQLTVRAGGKGNHALWIMGHLALADDVFVSAFRQQASCLPDDHGKLFAPGTAPLADAAAYPSRKELLQRLATARERMLGWVKSLEGEAAWQPTPEPLAKIAPDAISTAYTLVKHESIHSGQVTCIRASLELPPLFM